MCTTRAQAWPWAFRLNRETLTPEGRPERDDYAAYGSSAQLFRPSGYVDAKREQRAQPNLDWIGRIAFDPKNARSLHLELAGLLNHYEFYNPLNNRNFSITGWGVSLNALLEVAPRLTLITTNYYSNGGGDYIFGEAPDLIIQATGAPSLLASGSTVDGLEYNPTSNGNFGLITEEHG